MQKVFLFYVVAAVQKYTTLDTISFSKKTLLIAFSRMMKYCIMFIRWGGGTSWTTWVMRTPWLQEEFINS